ncbi:hypothetical protein Aph02nite_24990 [Actinoplanes philippinensis]|nr:hypothetical protein Aph02nite_24990 [Actinoplanes philippinensis]
MFRPTPTTPPGTESGSTPRANTGTTTRPGTEPGLIPRVTTSITRPPVRRGSCRRGSAGSRHSSARSRDFATTSDRALSLSAGVGRSAVAEPPDRAGDVTYRS